jgi:NADH-quinone oxidoreductase subunit H
MNVDATSIPPAFWSNLENLPAGIKHGLVTLVPEAWQPGCAILISIGAILAFFLPLFAITTLFERKGLGRIQNRPGPNRVGPFGLLQPAADGIKMLTKEDIVPRTADHWVHFLAPIVMLAPVMLALAVLPYGRFLVPVDLDAGILFFFAVGSASELAAFMAGWSSRNKYSILGAMRAIAQMISFELPLVISAVGVVLVTGSMALNDMVEAQSFAGGWLPRWNVFTPWGLAGFLLFFTAATAESNRSPFDLPEGESEIIGGFMTEYSGFKYAVFFMAEYFGMFAVCGLGVTLFLGGWQAPISWLTWIPSYFWFPTKLILLVGVLIWIRGTLPRLRADQLMNFAWKFLLPLALLNLFVAAVWQRTQDWTFTGALLSRWLLCGMGMALPYVLLAKSMARRRGWGPRAYRFAQ